MNQSSDDPMEETMITNEVCHGIGENHAILSSALRAASWNIAAINNNPFEYWVTNPNPDYLPLMQGVQNFIQDPANDIPLNCIFTDGMFNQLCSEMEQQSIGGIDDLSMFWRNDFSRRLAIRGFLQDKELGLKRLASMPDRVTNTINLSAGATCMRPTVVNAYDGGTLHSIDSWWQQWKKFMFYTEVQISTGKNTKAGASVVVCKLLDPISRSKYPAITVDEQAASVPLQILCLAILDAILVHMVNVVCPGSRWENVRKELCRELIQNKASKIRRILTEDYADMDVIFIQEAAAIFVQNFREDREADEKYAVLLPWNLDGKRDQNSLILVRREKFRESCSTDLTSVILDGIDGSWVAPGDLVAFSISDVAGRRWLLVSFHGDSNGLSTQPFMEALDSVARSRFKDHLLVVGLDANTHTIAPDVYHHSVESFCTFLAGHGMLSSWGETPDVSLHTTCSARTFLQTQQNKAVRFESRLSQKSLKDWIVVYRHQILVISKAIKDNTGVKQFLEGVVLPSLQFPSDHVIISASLLFKSVSSPTISAHNTGSDFSDDLWCVGSPIKASTSISKCTQPVTCVASQKSIHGLSSSREKTLYDYWGIRDKPVTETIFATVQGSSGVGTLESAHEMSLEQEISKICEEHYVQLVTKPHSEDFDTRRLIFSKVRDKSLWTMFSSRPVSMILCKGWGQLLFVAMSMQYLLEFTLNILAVVGVMSLHGAHFRFTPIMPRGWVAGATTNSSSLGLLMNGCIVSAPHNVSASAQSVFLDFGSTVRFNGWYFIAGEDSQGAKSEPVDFLFEASIDGYEWKEIKPQPWMRKEDYYHVPFQHISPKFVDLQPTWPWVLFWCFGMLWMSLGMLVPSILGAQGRGRQATIAECAGVSILGVLALVNGVYISVYFHDSVGILYLAMGLELLCFAWINFKEVYVIQLAAPVFSLFGITSYFEKQYCFPNPVLQISQYLPLVWTVMPLLTSMILNIVRWFVWKWVFQTLVGQEKALYDAAWAQLVACDKETGALEKLRKYSEQISVRVTKGPVLQRHSAIQSMVLGGASSHEIPERGHGQHQTVALSLDKLFTQAAALDPFLRHKVKELGLKSNGLLPVRAEAGGNTSKYQYEFQKCESIASSYAYGRVIWAKLKPAERALEKLLRVYSCEVSRLLDCCRQRILFDDPGHMIACLEAMIQDEEIEIVRIKNRLDSNYDSCFSGGFRNVVINFRIRSSFTRKLGIDNHICELQLIPTNLASCLFKCEDYHTRYLILRNCRDFPSFFSDMYKEIAKLSKILCTTNNGSIYECQRIQLHIEAGCGSLDDKNLNLQQKKMEGILQPAAIVGFESEIVPFKCTQAGSGCEETNEITEDIDETFTNEIAAGPAKMKSGSKKSTFLFQREAILEKQFFSSMMSLTQYRGPKYNKDKLLEDAIAQTPVGAIWDTSHPFAAALCKPWIPVLIFLTFASLMFNLVLGVNLIRKNALHTGNSLRFTALDNRSGISSLGFLRDSCSHESISLQQRRSQNSINTVITVSYAEEFTMNGWWVSVPLASIDQFPTRFYVEISGISGVPSNFSSSNENWEKVGSSSFFWTWSGSLLFFEGSFNLARPSQEVKIHMKGQEMIVEFDMRLPWIWCYAKWGSNITLICLTVSVSATSYLKRQMQGRWWCACFWLIVHIVELLACIGYVCTGQTALAFLSGIFCASDLIFSFVLAFHEKYFRQLNGFCGSLFFGAVIAHYLYLESPQEIIGCYLGFENRGLFDGMGLLVLSCSGYMARMYSRRSAERVIAESQAAYDICWSRLLQVDRTSLAIKRIGEYIDSISQGLPQIIRQRGSILDEHMCEDHSFNNCKESCKLLKRTGSKSNLPIFSIVKKTLRVHPQQDFWGSAKLNAGGEGALVLDLDQLFAQAEVVDLLLQQKVQQWALISSGCFPVASSADTIVFERWDKIAGNEDMLENVKWGRVKSLKRAIEKLYRSYNCDVSRLLDCCRKSIIFEDLNDLLTCMKAIANDPECKIVRAKNRLRADYDSSLTAGYRDVGLNLQVITSETKRLRIENHVCEVQLIPIDFAKLKTEAGHQRYVSWRNLKGE